MKQPGAHITSVFAQGFQVISSAVWVPQGEFSHSPWANWPLWRVHTNPASTFMRGKKKKKNFNPSYWGSSSHQCWDVLLCCSPSIIMSLKFTYKPVKGSGLTSALQSAAASATSTATLRNIWRDKRESGCWWGGARKSARARFLGQTCKESRFSYSFCRCGRSVWTESGGRIRGNWRRAEEIPAAPSGFFSSSSSSSSLSNQSRRRGRSQRARIQFFYDRNSAV